MTRQGDFEHGSPGRDLSDDESDCASHPTDDTSAETSTSDHAGRGDS